MLFRNTPIQQKLIAVILLTSGTVLLLTCIAFFAYEFVTFRKDNVREIGTLGKIIAANSTAALAFNDRDDANEILAALQAQPHIVAAALYDQNGYLFSYYPPHLSPGAFPTGPGKIGYRFEESYLAGFQQVIEGNKRLGTLYLKSDIEAIYDRFQLYGVIAFLVIVVSSMLAYQLSRILQRQISRPILALAGTARAISDRRDYSVRAEKFAADELGLLTDAFNHMLTQIHEQNQALSESEARVRAVLNSALSAVVVMDAVGKITDWNARAEKMFGWTRGEVLGQELAEIVLPPRYRKIQQRVLKRYVATGKSPFLNRLLEMTALRRDGSEFPVELSFSALKRGDTLAFCGFITDITERAQAEEALRESETRFRTLADNMAQLAWMCNNLGWATWYNKRWYDYTGTTFEEMQGRGWTKVHHPDHLDRVVQKLEEYFKTGKPWEDTFPLRGRDGKYRWFLSRAIPIRDQDGQIVRWFGTNTDITEQRELQEALREADRRKDEFLATLAHELRNPLAPLQTGLDLMKLRKKDPESVEKVRDMMERQLSQLVRLVDDLLDVSRIARGKFELRKEPVKLSEVVESALETSRPLIEQSGHELIVNVPSEPIFVDADLTRLAQAFANLLNNAAKYTKRGGCIKLTVKQQNDTVLISVKDNGVGIPATMLPHVFEIFLQADNSQGGLGIGLGLVKQLVEMHGGTVEAHSEGHGKGSEFVIRLPVLTPAMSMPELATSSQEPVSSPAGHRILVADDNPDVAVSMAMMLESIDNEVHIAHDGLKAVEIAKQIRPHLILLDIGMPKLNGYEACRLIRAEQWGSDVIIVAITGWGQEHDKLQSRKAGFDHHLVKPVQLRTLEKMLAELPVEKNLKGV